jgi:hypothetical protein
MRRPRRSLLAALLLALGACGNYSNEDLEFMNAVPARDDLTASIPPKPISTGNEAELSAQTHDAVRGFNGMLDGVLALVEAVRSYEPTSRGRDEQKRETRTWGPIPATDDATGALNGWEWRFVMARETTPSTVFDYRLELRPLGDPDAVWTAFIAGGFDAAVGVRRGNGHFLVDFKSLRELGYPFKDEDRNLNSVALTYTTATFPIQVSMMMAAVDGTTATVDYAAQDDGSGSLTFTLIGDLIDLTPAIETLAITSRWLPSGAGRSDLVVQSGDGAGLRRTQCWNDSFVATYENKAWAPADNFGDPSLCPAISGL